MVAKIVDSPVRRCAPSVIAWMRVCVCVCYLDACARVLGRGASTWGLQKSDSHVLVGSALQLRLGAASNSSIHFGRNALVSPLIDWKMLERGAGKHVGRVCQVLLVTPLSEPLHRPRKHLELSFDLARRAKVSLRGAQFWGSNRHHAWRCRSWSAPRCVGAQSGERSAYFGVVTSQNAEETKHPAGLMSLRACVEKGADRTLGDAPDVRITTPQIQIRKTRAGNASRMPHVPLLVGDSHIGDVRRPR